MSVWSKRPLKLLNQVLFHGIKHHRTLQINLNGKILIKYHWILIIYLAKSFYLDPLILVTLKKNLLVNIYIDANVVFWCKDSISFSYKIISGNCGNPYSYSLLNNTHSSFPIIHKVGHNANVGIRGFTT